MTKRSGPTLPRWSRSERESRCGAVESREWIGLSRELVPADVCGARELGSRYLHEVGHFSRGLVTSRAERNGVAFLLAGIVPLLRFGAAEVSVTDGRVECRYPIVGGLLVARPGGSLWIIQSPSFELELTVEGYFPRLGGSMRRRSFRRALYTALQVRAHRAVGRRFLERAATETNL